MTTQQRGTLAELKVTIKAIEKGYTVSKPISDARYDLVLDKKGKLLRAQIKYADGNVFNCDGSIPIPLRKIHKNRTLVYSKNEIDIVLAYLPSVDKIIVLLPKHFHNKKTIQIRVMPPKNGQTHGLNMLNDFIW